MRPRKAARSVVLAKEEYNIRSRDMKELAATFVPFTAQTRMSGIDAGSSSVPQGRGGCDPQLHRWRHRADHGQRKMRFVHQPAVATEASRELQAIADAIAKEAARRLPLPRTARLLGASTSRTSSRAASVSACRTAPHGHPHRDDHGR